MARSGSGIAAIAASTSASPSAFFAPLPRREAAFTSRARSFIAARSSSENPSGVVLFAMAPLLSEASSGCLPVPVRLASPP